MAVMMFPLAGVRNFARSVQTIPKWTVDTLQVLRQLKVEPSDKIVYDGNIKAWNRQNDHTERRHNLILQWKHKCERLPNKEESG